MGSFSMEKKWAFPVVISSLLFIVLLATTLNISSINNINSWFSILPSKISVSQRDPTFVESKVEETTPPPPARPRAPRFAYLVSGSRGDLNKLWRTLQALYHPLNQYIVHLDLESPPEERLELTSRLEKDPLFTEVGNVHMIKKANLVTYRGPTMVANTLHACALLLRKNKDWDWFINLSASDYPLVTQDDLISTFTDLNRSANFVEHTSQLGWKAGQRAMPLMVDPGLYQTTKEDIFWVRPKRQLPTAFKLFTGSAWMVLSRAFVEYLVWGWDNLPRTLLMYYTNFVSSPEGYFHTVICNVPEFAQTAINHDLHFISWDNPPRQHPHILNVTDTGKMIASNAAFARKFNENNTVLDMIDKDFLHRENGRFTPGGWCSGTPSCSKVGDPTLLRPGPGAKRLRRLIDSLTLTDKLALQCK